MHPLTVSFLLAIGLSTAVRLWLSQRQLRSLAEHRTRVPHAFVEHISLEAHQKAADYTAELTRLGRIDTVLSGLIALVFTLGGGIQWLDTHWNAVVASPLWRGVLVILSFMLISSLIDLPLSIWRTFRVEAKFGFNRVTPKLFVSDLLKGLVLGLVLGVPLLIAVLYLMERAGALWWVYAWLLWTAFTLLVSWAYPTFIAPLFNKFSPLSDASLKTRVENLLQRCGFASKGIFVVDGSRRSAHGNAYFTGLGKNKRIVFFDTLMERLAPAEIEAVLAHELGHFRLHHVRQRLVLSLILGLAGFALLGALVLWPSFYTALGVNEASGHAALLLLMLVLPAFTFFLTPLGSWWSRKHEFQADEFASEHADAQELARALVKLYRDNATTLTPDHVHSAFYDSHPPAPIRIARLQSIGIH
ncbi:MAG: M48 family metallopeptidase [Steroidobacteraceae bacterium]